MSRAASESLPPSADTPAFTVPQVQLAVAARLASLGGHDDFNQGQISGRLPGRRRFWIKRALCGFDEATPTDMIVCDSDPSAEQHPEAPPELALHQAIYAARSDVNSIVHTHGPACLAFGATDLEIRPIAHEGAYFAGSTSRFKATSQTILDLDIARQVAACLDDNKAVFLQNHGVVVVGRSVREAAVALIMLERHCDMQLRLESLNRGYATSSDDDVEGKRAFIYAPSSIKTYWDHHVRLTKRVMPEIEEWAR